MIAKNATPLTPPSACVNNIQHMTPSDQEKTLHNVVSRQTIFQQIWTFTSQFDPNCLRYQNYFGAGHSVSSIVKFAPKNINIWQPIVKLNPGQTKSGRTHTQTPNRKSDGYVELTASGLDQNGKYVNNLVFQMIHIDIGIWSQCESCSEFHLGHLFE